MKSSPDTPTSPINPWNYKPWWCQPWSILLTGIGVVSGSWIVFHTLWLTVLVTIPISAWMGFFLLIWPQLVIAQINEPPTSENS